MIVKFKMIVDEMYKLLTVEIVKNLKWLFVVVFE